MQQRYTYLRPRPGASFSPQCFANEDIHQYCKNRPITLLAYAALMAGAYSRKDRSIQSQYLGADADTRMKALEKVANEKGITENQLVLAWMLHGDPFVLPLIAASTEEQLRENIRALEVSLSQEEMKLLNETAGHIAAIKYTKFAPIFAQQSFRENARTRRTLQQVMDDAKHAVESAGWEKPWGADADHLKTPDDLLPFVQAGYTFYTVDPGAYVGNSTDTDPLVQAQTR